MRPEPKTMLAALLTEDSAVRLADISPLLCENLGLPLFDQCLNFFN